MNIYLKKFAELLINYSVSVKTNEKVIINGNIEAEPLIEQIYIQLLKKGAYPIIRLNLNNKQELFYKYAKRKHLERLSKIALYETKNTDALIRIIASTNTKSLTSVNPGKQSIFMKTNKPLSDLMIKKDRWVLTLYPTQAYAQDAEMSLDEFREFVFKALLLDKINPINEWNLVKTNQEKIIRRLKNANKIKLISKDTDLTLSVKGRKFINSCGFRNMPSGEVFTGPVETSLNGHIKFSFPACYAGREVDGVYLEFNNGKVVNAKAKKNEKFLHAMLDTDKGARYAGEFAFGLNYGIKRFIKNILFDEKIGGTIHIAVGKSYPETGGKNSSAIHWDMIKDFRKTGEVYVDEKLFLKKGKVLL